MLPDSLKVIGSRAFSIDDDASLGVNVSIDGGISGIAEDAFSAYNVFEIDTLLIRGSGISGALCTALQKISRKRVLVTSESGFKVNQSLCNGIVTVTGFADPTPFPTAPASLSPRVIMSRSPLASSSPLPPSSETTIWKIVGVVLGEIGLIVIAVVVTILVMRRRRSADENIKSFNVLTSRYT
jgi:hypothetical protein